ncbi:MAG: hypothetical protein LQ340_005694, partial [Diploschistes diacapsis]
MGNLSLEEAKDRLDADLESCFAANATLEHPQRIEERATRHLQNRLYIINEARRWGKVTSQYAAWKSCE